MDKDSVKEIFERITMIFDNCNDSRIWEIQKQLSEFLKWYSENFNIKMTNEEWMKRNEELLNFKK